MDNHVCCYCGKPAVARTFWTLANPGRRFYGCQEYERNQGCGFFRWCDAMCDRCDRSTEIIGGFLNTIRELEATNLRLKKWLKVALIIAFLAVAYNFL